MTVRSKTKQEKDRVRSMQRQQKYTAQKQAQIDLADAITRTYSWRDKNKVPGEIVFTAESVPVIREKLKEAFNGAEPASALNHEFGEVLNHFA